MPFIFDYSQFFSFYSTQFLPPITFWYFKQTNRFTGTWSDFSIVCNTGFTFQDGTSIYITFPPSPNVDMFMFFNIHDTSRQYKNGILADHITFGIKDLKKKWIDMHLSVQQPNQSVKVDHFKCFLTDQTRYTSVKEITCTYPKGDQLTTVFPNNVLDLLEKLFSVFKSVPGGKKVIKRKTRVTKNIKSEKTKKN
jgi:hypothetical protein